MQITNKLNLPEALVQSIINDPYKKKSDFTATELPVPPQIRALRLRYNNQINVDASDLIYPLIGNNTHYILERIGVKNALSEERLFTKFNNLIISGQIDFYDSDKIIWDYKVTTRYVLIDGIKPDWEAQLNINTYLMIRNGFKVNGAKICAIFRDWSKIQAAKVPDYPKKQVAVLPATMWEPKDTEQWIEERIHLHQLSEELHDHQLPLCTPEERWEKPTTYAIKKGKNKRAVRVLSSADEARQYMEDRGLDEGYSIEKRLGESTRCEYYCDVKEFCKQYNKEA